VAQVQALLAGPQPPLVDDRDNSFRGFGWTALMHAARNGHRSVVEVLVGDWKADVHAQDNWLRTARNVAKTKEIKEYLRVS
jgi:ankyrin repeat protein